jgi:outer membrane receptor protein involved in Fe transport
LHAFSQHGFIEGSVADTETGEFIPFASVALFTSGSFDPVKGTVSNEEGYFRVDGLEYLDYDLVISFIGFRPDTIRNIQLNRQTHRINIGAVSLSPDYVELDEVEVTAMAKTVRTGIDRKIYRAQDFETARGGTAVEVLNKLPSVSVDPDGKVSVRGTTDFMVYLNGKPTLMDPSALLAQLSGDAIESIEVITVPTARYDAQGTGGIVNINTLRKASEGLSVSANGLLGGAPWGHFTTPYQAYEQNDNRYGAGLNLIYHRKDLSVFGGLFYNHRNVNGKRTGDARLLQSDGSYYHMVAGGERPEWYKTFSGNAGFDLQLNGSSNLSGSYYFGKRREGRSAFYVYHNFYGDVLKDSVPGIPVNEDWIYNPNTDNRYGKFHVANLDYSRSFDETSDIKVSLLYEHSGLSRGLDNQNFDFDPETGTVGNLEEHFRQSDDTPLDGVRFSVEYEKAFGNGQALGLGFQPQYLHQSGPFSYDTLGVSSSAWGDYADFENAIDLRRGIYAGYADYSGAFGKLNYIAGIRMEYTVQTLDIENPDYFSIFERETKPRYEVNQLDWFPTLHLNYEMSEKNELTLSASRRINRPPTKNMAPFLYRRHYEVYVVGDPALKPEYLNNLELSFDRKLGRNNLNLTGFYRGTSNAIFRVNTVYEEENVLIRSYTNSGNATSLGAELNGNFELGSFAKFFLGGSLYNYRIDADIFGYREDNSSTNWSLKGNLNLMITDDLKMTVDFDLKSATVTAQGKNEMFYTANTALRYTPEKLKGWDFSVKVLDFLNSNITGLDTRAHDQTGVQIFYQETEYTRFGPIAELTVSYSFNMNGKSGRKTESTFGKEQF